MKKTIRLTEADLTRIVRRVIEEQSSIGTTQTPSSKTPQQIFAEFPCLKSPDVKMMNGKFVFQRKTLIPETLPYNDPSYEEAVNRTDAYKKRFGKVQGGGYFFCSAFSPNTLVVKA